MNIIEIIDTKKTGNTLSKEQIDFWINGMMDGSIEDYQTSALLMAICLKGFNKQESVDLTQAMLHSGKSVDLSCFGDLSVDKHSSGGVGDSTTFVVLPILAALGYKGAKASGRGLGFTGGTLDKLESIPGLTIDINKEKFFNQVKDIGLAVVGQSADICPADKRLYALRDVTDTIDNIGLIAASIMSKKLASGAKNIVLDVKCGRGAFMKDIDSAIALAERMVEIGKANNRNISAVVSNMDYPLDNFIGNSLEIYGALQVLKSVKNNLYEVAITLTSELLTSMGVENAREKCDEMLSTGAALEKFIKMINYQGGDISYLINSEKLLGAKNVVDVVAKTSGYIVDIEPLTISKVVANMGGGRIKVSDIIDLYCGIDIKVAINAKVEAGDVLATLYYSKPELDLESLTQSAFTIADSQIPNPTMIYKIIR